MDGYLIVLRVIHIVSGVLWVGGAFFITLFVEPAAKAAGPDGGKMMERLTATRFPQILTLSAALAILSGLLLYWRSSAGFQLAWVKTPTGLAFAAGGAAALAAICHRRLHGPAQTCPIGRPRTGGRRFWWAADRRAAR